MDQSKLYLSAVATEVNVVLRLEPRLCTTAMIATEMPAAISPYSMAVAPSSFFRNRITTVFIVQPFALHANPPTPNLITEALL